MTRALSRAAALEDELRARRPIEQGFSNETRQTYAAQIMDICRALGFFPSECPASRTVRRGRFQTCPYTATPTPPVRRRSTTAVCRSLRAGATGPPVRLHREDADIAEIKPPTRVYPWSFSRRAPASLSLYALS